MNKKILAFLLTLLIVSLNCFTAFSKEVNYTELQKGSEVNSAVSESIKAMGNSYSSPKPTANLSVNYLLPSNYPLIAPNSYAGTLLDSWNSYHYVTFESVEQATISANMNLKLFITTDYYYAKDMYYTVEFFKENNNQLNYFNCINYAINDEYKNWRLTSSVAKTDFSDQEYIYIRLGVSSSYYSSYYSDTLLFKVKNPYYIARKPATGVSLDKNTVSLNIGDTISLTPTIYPVDASNKNVTWSSSNYGVATVDNYGKVVVVGKGTAIITVTTVDGGYTASCTVAVMDIEAVRNFVKRFYEQCLKRQADEAGLSYWADRLKSGVSTGADVAKNFIFSPEFLNSNVSDNEFVDIMYKAFFDRDSDSQGKTYWLNNLSNGISRLYVLASFVNSQEFNNICNSYGILMGRIVLTSPADIHPDVAAFTFRFYEKCLSRKPDDSGLNYWVSALVSGQSTAADLSVGFVFSPEFTSKNLSDSDFVAVMYRVFFDREPDSAGQAYWVKVMSNGNSRKYVLANFVSSQEFKNICNTYGIKTGSVTP